MDDEQLYELGVDFNSSFTFKDGDIQLVEYDENLIQSITNKFNTDLDELGHFYEDYGSTLKSFFGWKRNEETLSFIQSEVETVLQSEERLLSWKIDVKFTDDGKLRINLELYPNSDYSIDVNYELTDDGFEVVE